MKRFILTVLLFGGLASCSNSSPAEQRDPTTASVDKALVENHETSNNPSREGFLSYKANGVLFTCKPETVRGFYTQVPRTGSFGGVVDDSNSLRMSYKSDNPTGEVPKKIGNSTNYPKLMHNGFLYEDVQSSIDFTVVITDVVEMSKGVYVISGTFEGTFEHHAGNKVTITEGKFATPIPLRM